MNSAAATNSVTPSTQNPKKQQQRQTAKEMIAANVKVLIAQLSPLPKISLPNIEIS